jgi:beta-N-acetylhexosaminidase
VVTDLLKTRLGFGGLVVTDALDMAGLTQLYADDIGRSAVDAFKAGNDLLLIPADLDASFAAVLAAARSGEIGAARLDEAALKLLRWKAALRLHKERTVDVARVATRVGRPEAAAAAQAVADAALTLVRDNGKVLPLAPAALPAAGLLPYAPPPPIRNRLVAVVFSPDLATESGRVFAAELRARVPDANVFVVDPRTAAAAAEDVRSAVREAEAVVAAVYAIPEPGQAASSATGPAALLRSILDEAGAKTAVVALGSPYVAATVPAVSTYLCTFSDASVSERSAVRALFGEVAVRGRLPVTIPGVAERGAGLDRALEP